MKFENGTRIFWKSNQTADLGDEGFGTIEKQYTTGEQYSTYDYWIFLDGKEDDIPVFESELKVLPTSKDLIAFYDGTGKDFEGRTIAEILAFDDEKLESDHSWIQYVFPLPEMSRYNPFAPIMNEEVQNAFLEEDTPITDNIAYALNRWEKFIGYGGGCLVWLTKGNHNFLRISRFLRFLALTNYKSDAEEYLNWFLELNEKFPDIVSNTTIEFWKAAAKGEIYSPG